MVHMRRPFFKLKDFSEDAMMILKLFDAIFREDKLIKAGFSNTSGKDRNGMDDSAKKKTNRPKVRVPK